MADRQVALIRGINVGKAKRVAMADLRALVESLGYGDVRTLLNSGNVVFTANGVAPGEAAARIEEGLAKGIGVPARVIVLTAKELAAAVDGNPLGDVATNPSRFFVAVLATPADRRRLEPVGEARLDPGGPGPRHARGLHLVPRRAPREPAL